MEQFTIEEQKLKQFLMDYATEQEIENIRQSLIAENFKSADEIIEQIMERI